MGWIVFLEDCIGCVLGLFCLIFLGVLFVFFILELLKLSGVFLQVEDFIECFGDVMLGFVRSEMLELESLNFDVFLG